MQPVPSLLFAALALCLPSLDVAFAQQAAAPVTAQPNVTTATYENWMLRCVRPAAAQTSANDPGKICEIVQTVQVQGQSQPLAQVAIGRLPGDKALTLTAVMPLNISIPGTVHLSGNGKTGAEEKGGLELSWQRCLPSGCIATARPDAKLFATLDPQTDGQIRFADAAGRTLGIPLSWKGLDQALKALDKS